MLLKSVPKRYNQDSQHSISPEETVARATAAFKKFPEEQGVFENLEEIGHLDSMGLPVYKVNCQNRHNEWGKGISEAQSQASAIMERVERFSSIAKNWENPLIIKDKKFSEIKENVISYWDFVPCNLNRALWTKEKINELPMDWVKIFSLRDKKEKWVPAQMAFLSYRQKKYTDYGCSTGLAAGNTLEEAIAQAIGEVLERHFLHTISLNREETETIDLKTANNPELKKLLKNLKDKGFEILAHNFSGGWNICTVSVFVFNPKEKVIFQKNGYIKYGTAIDPEVALIRAITEIAQNRAVMLYGKYFQSGETFFKSVDKEIAEEYDWRLKNSQKISIQDLPNISRNDFKEDIDLMVQEIARKGYDTLVFDLTHPIIQIPVARIIIPGLQPNFLLLGRKILDKKSRISRHLKIYDQVVLSCKRRVFADQRIDN
jgi:YcaO-like protein with predicted kinase domain